MFALGVVVVSNMLAAVLWTRGSITPTMKIHLHVSPPIMKVLPHVSPSMSEASAKNYMRMQSSGRFMYTY